MGSKRGLGKRILWLNGSGVITNDIIFESVQEAALGVDPEGCFSMLDALSDHAPAGVHVRDPTAWLCAGLRRLQNKQRSLPEGPLGVHSFGFVLGRPTLGGRGRF